jgi:hypothetical protein
MLPRRLCVIAARALNNGISAAFNWKKEIVLVTGGADGIGYATVKKFASGGPRVVLVDVLPLSAGHRMYHFLAIGRADGTEIFPAQRQTCSGSSAT